MGQRSMQPQYRLKQSACWLVKQWSKTSHTFHIFVTSQNLQSDNHTHFLQRLLWGLQLLPHIHIKPVEFANLLFCPCFSSPIRPRQVGFFSKRVKANSVFYTHVELEHNNMMNDAALKHNALTTEAQKSNQLKSCPVTDGHGSKVTKKASSNTANHTAVVIHLDFFFF